MSEAAKVCVIGAGASGMCLMGALTKLKDEGHPVEVTCYEKQTEMGGLWNYSWRTGLAEHGEAVHHSQYKDLFSNSPKEVNEFPEYTFEEHFGKAIPSFPPRPVVLDYLKGYWKFMGIDTSYIHLSHSVQNVSYSEESEKFTVRVIDLTTGKDKVEIFDYCVVSVGHFSTPNVPEFPGLASFPGRVLHSHDFRNAEEFAGLRVLVIGNSFSGEDIAMHAMKFGATSATISYRSQPVGFNWPEGISEKPLVTEFKGRLAHFGDGTSAEFDVAILATGYLVHIPFMEREYRLESPTTLNVPDLYRGVLWTPTTEGKKRAGNRLYYMAMQYQGYTFTMFQQQAIWIARAVKGLLEIPTEEECHAEVAQWVGSNAELTDVFKKIRSQSDYLLRLAADTGYTEKVDASEVWIKWAMTKKDVATYRDVPYRSLITGTMAPTHPIPWYSLKDDSIEAYVNFTPTTGAAVKESVEGEREQATVGGA